MIADRKPGKCGAELLAGILASEGIGRIKALPVAPPARPVAERPGSAASRTRSPGHPGPLALLDPD
jgi:hypothetical protein